jgi:hypothetical protein
MINPEKIFGVEIIKRDRYMAPKKIREVKVKFRKNLMF